MVQTNKRYSVLFRFCIGNVNVENIDMNFYEENDWKVLGNICSYDNLVNCSLY